MQNLVNIFGKSHEKRKFHQWTRIEGNSRVKKNTVEKPPAKTRIHDTYTDEISRIKTVANPLKGASTPIGYFVRRNIAQ